MPDLRGVRKDQTLTEGHSGKVAALPSNNIFQGEGIDKDRARVHWHSTTTPGVHQPCHHPPRPSGIHQGQPQHMSSIHPPQLTTSGVHQQRRERINRINIPSTQSILQTSSGHDNVGPSSDVLHRDNHLFHTIIWGQVTWCRFVQAFDQLDTGRILGKLHSL